MELFIYTSVKCLYTEYTCSLDNVRSKYQQALIVPTKEQTEGFELGLTTKITSE